MPVTSSSPVMPVPRPSPVISFHLPVMSPITIPRRVGPILPVIVLVPRRSRHVPRQVARSRAGNAALNPLQRHENTLNNIRTHKTAR